MEIKTQELPGQKSSVLIIYCLIPTQANSGRRQQMVSTKVQSKNVKVVQPATNFMSFNIHPPQWFQVLNTVSKKLTKLKSESDRFL